jgi:hypothetical protein
MAVFEGKKEGKPSIKLDLPVMVALTGQFWNYFIEDLLPLVNVSQLFGFDLFNSIVS